MFHTLTQWCLIPNVFKQDAESLKKLNANLVWLLTHHLQEVEQHAFLKEKTESEKTELNFYFTLILGFPLATLISQIRNKIVVHHNQLFIQNVQKICLLEKIFTLLRKLKPEWLLALGAVVYNLLEF